MKVPSAVGVICLLLLPASQGAGKEPPRRTSPWSTGTAAEP